MAKIPKYDFKKIEKKWQKFWQDNQTNQFDLDKAKRPFYNLMMFPYPSAEGLHVGGVYTFTGVDTFGRYKRMKGYDVFQPIGLDGFGIHSENYAMKIGQHIKEVSRRTEKNFYRQLHSVGNMYDWSRTVETYKPEYYKWTQWLFLQMYKKGLAYRKKAKVNWCPSCKTVLSDEQVIAGKCERCDSEVVKKELNQWFFAITKYADKLLKNLEWIDWPEDVKLNQKNWIGKSEGALIKFQITNNKLQIKSKIEKIKNNNQPTSQPANQLEVFTTRPDTIFGATYMVIAPEHKIISNNQYLISNYKEVSKYIEKALGKSEQERKADEKEKTGVEIKGIRAVNPATGEEIPIWVADYVLGDYGTGAIMAVPAHDERDFEFARKYKMDVVPVVSPVSKEDYETSKKTLENLSKILGILEKEKIKVWLLGGLACAFHCGFIYRKHDDIDLIVENKEDMERATRILEKNGFKKTEEKFLDDDNCNYIFRNSGGTEVDLGFFFGGFSLIKKDFLEKEVELEGVKSMVLSKRFIKKFKKYQLDKRGKDKDKLDYSFLSCELFEGDGTSINSGFLSGLETNEAKEKIIEWLEKTPLNSETPLDSSLQKGETIGKKSIDYKLRDWCISRQRYWGPPIPIIYCKKCGIVPVPEENLPVELPDMKDFLPEGKGKGPLAKNKEFVETKCPVCGGQAERETDVSDPFVDSSWYFFRYPSTEFHDQPFDKKRTQKWLPVDSYIGGKEHTVLHLLYSRFVTMVLNDLGMIDFEEPYKRFFGHGLITKDGAKMSKSRGNVVNPDEMIEKYGADATRLYMRFLGDFSQGGDWRDSGIAGMHKFVKKVWTIFYELGSLNGEGVKNMSMIDKTIKVVGEDIEKLSFNTAVARIMEFVNWIRDNQKDFSEKQVGEIRKMLALILAPMAPHLAEEFWLQAQTKIDRKTKNPLSPPLEKGETLRYNSIFDEKWPQFDSKKIIDKEIELVVQINGRVRDRISVSKDIAKEEAEKMALGSDKVQKHLEGKKVKKVIYVPGRLVSIVF